MEGHFAGALKFALGSLGGVKTPGSYLGGSAFELKKCIATLDRYDKGGVKHAVRILSQMKTFEIFSLYIYTINDKTWCVCGPSCFVWPWSSQ